MSTVLIMGLGRMGKIHAKHLTEMGVSWEYFDPYIPGGVARIDIRRYTHAVIATPTDIHVESYRMLDGFSGQILIEKPVTTDRHQLCILDDPRIFAGMVERFNPAVVTLKRQAREAEIVTLDFFRTSATGVFEDIGIHDIDLFVHLLDIEELPQIEWHPGGLILHAGRFEGHFAWQASPTRITEIISTLTTGVVTTDLVKQSINGVTLPHAWPIQRELQCFLAGDSLNAKLSHRLFVECLQSQPSPKGRNDAKRTGNSFAQLR